MSPLVLRRILLTALVLICLMWVLAANAGDPILGPDGWQIDYGEIAPLSEEVKDSEGRLRALANQCPPSDGYRWYYNPASPHADRVEWIEVFSPREFAQDCLAPGQYPNVRIDGCAIVRRDPMYGGYTGFVYAVGARYAFPPAFVMHEECHLLGWRHESVTRQIFNVEKR